MFGGFLSEEHRALFEARRAEARKPFGHPDRALCGARTRNGAVCRCVPVQGFQRCRKHVGPAGSRVIRRRELEALARGELAWEDWLRLERRRAVNRLRDLWRKKPWTPGSTIDLGETGEAAFRAEMGRLGLDATEVAPAVLDWLRWRFRRARLDRDQPRVWAETVAGIGDRVARAGPRPPEAAIDAPAFSEPVWTAPARVSPWSKRRRLDPSRPKRAPRAGALPTIGQAQLAELLDAHRDALAPILARFCTEEERLAVAAAFEALVKAQGAPGAFEAYHRALRAIEQAATSAQAD